jgi:hypothetical protein
LKLIIIYYVKMTAHDCSKLKAERPCNQKNNCTWHKNKCVPSHPPSHSPSPSHSHSPSPSHSHSPSPSHSHSPSPSHSHSPSPSLSPMHLAVACRPSGNNPLPEGACDMARTQADCPKDGCAWGFPNDLMRCMPSTGSDSLPAECDMARSEYACNQMKSQNGKGCTWGEFSPPGSHHPKNSGNSGMSDTTIGLIIGGSLLAVFGLVILGLTIRAKSMKGSMKRSR